MTYTVVLEWDDYERVYNASVPALPGCFAWGHTKREALSRTREVIALMLEAMEDVGDSIPNDADDVQLSRVRVS